MALVPWMNVAGVTGRQQVKNITTGTVLATPTGDARTVTTATQYVSGDTTPIYHMKTRIAGTLSSTQEQSWPVSQKIAPKNIVTLNDTLIYARDNLETEAHRAVSEMFHTNLVENYNFTFDDNANPKAVYMLGPDDDNDVLFPGASPVHVQTYRDLTQETNTEITTALSDESLVTMMEPATLVAALRIAFTPLPGLILGYRVKPTRPNLLNIPAGSELFVYADKVVKECGGKLVATRDGALVSGIDHLIFPVFSHFTAEIQTGTPETDLARFILSMGTFSPFTEYPSLHAIVGLACHAFFDQNGVKRGDKNSMYRVDWSELTEQRYTQSELVALNYFISKTIHIEMADTQRLYCGDCDVVQINTTIHTESSAIMTREMGYGLLAGHGVDITRLDAGPISFLANSPNIAHLLTAMGFAAFPTGMINGLTAVTMFLSRDDVHIMRQYTTRGKYPVQFLYGLMIDNMYTLPASPEQLGNRDVTMYAMLSVAEDVAPTVVNVLEQFTSLCIVLHNTHMGIASRLIGLKIRPDILSSMHHLVFLQQVLGTLQGEQNQFFNNQCERIISNLAIASCDHIPPAFFRAAFLYTTPFSESAKGMSRVRTITDLPAVTCYVAMLSTACMFVYDEVIGVLDGERHVSLFADMEQIVTQKCSTRDVFIRASSGLSQWLTVAPIMNEAEPLFDTNITDQFVSRIKAGELTVFTEVMELHLFDRESIIFGLSQDGVVTVPRNVAMNTVSLIMSCGRSVISYFEAGDNVMLSFTTDPRIGVEITHVDLSFASPDTVFTVPQHDGDPMFECLMDSGVVTIFQADEGADLLE